VILDLDHFKEINDSYGHPVGDLMLKEIAKILKNNIRASDSAARWGGEEFLIILPQTNFPNAMAAAEKIRADMDQAQFPVAGHMTCSFGVASVRKDDDQDKLLNPADEALYEAKKNGRNRVIGQNSDH